MFSKLWAQYVDTCASGFVLQEEFVMTGVISENRFEASFSSLALMQYICICTFTLLFSLLVPSHLIGCWC